MPYETARKSQIKYYQISPTLYSLVISKKDNTLVKLQFGTRCQGNNLQIKILSSKSIRTASVVAASDVHCATLSGQNFRKILGEYMNKKLNHKL